jgi:hypothetical protein
MRMRFAGFTAAVSAVVSFAVLHSGCKTRNFNGSLKSANSSENYDYSKLLQSMSKNKADPSQNILVYVHGFNNTALPVEDFISISKKEKSANEGQLSADWVDTLKAENWNVLNFAWHTLARTTEILPVLPEVHIWTSERSSPKIEAEKSLGPTLCNEFSSYLKIHGPKKNRNPPVEIRLVGHNLGSQIAVLCGYQLIVDNYSDWPEQQKKIRLDLLDPILGNPSYPYQMLHDAKQGISQTLRKEISELQLFMMEELNKAGVPLLAFGATFHTLLSPAYFERVLFQQMHSKWLGGIKGSNTLNGMRDAYFRSFTEAQPPIAINTSSIKKQGFSAKYPTESISKLTPPLLLLETSQKNNRDDSLASKSFALITDPKNQFEMLENLPVSAALVVAPRAINTDVILPNDDDMFIDDSGSELGGVYTRLSAGSQSLNGGARPVTEAEKEQSGQDLKDAQEKAKRLGFDGFSLSKTLRGWFDAANKIYPFSKITLVEESCSQAVKVTTQFNKVVARSKPFGIPAQMVIDRCTPRKEFSELDNAELCLFGELAEQIKNHSTAKTCKRELAKIFHPDTNLALVKQNLMSLKEQQLRKNAFDLTTQANERRNKIYNR